jgi:hypothetical protein
VESCNGLEEKKLGVLFVCVCVCVRSSKNGVGVKEREREREKKHKKQQTKNKPLFCSSPNFLVVLCRTAIRPK